MMIPCHLRSGLVSLLKLKVTLRLGNDLRHQHKYRFLRLDAHICPGLHKQNIFNIFAAWCTLAVVVMIIANDSSRWLAV